jgi:hypothetical protein
MISRRLLGIVTCRKKQIFMTTILIWHEALAAVDTVCGKFNVISSINTFLVLSSYGVNGE